MYNALTTRNSYPFLDIRSNAGSIYRSITQPRAQVRPLDNDKEMTETDALSLIILELNYSRPFDPETDSVQVSWLLCVEDILLVIAVLLTSG